jgi:hypothetical protein
MAALVHALTRNNIELPICTMIHGVAASRTANMAEMIVWEEICFRAVHNLYESSPEIWDYLHMQYKDR